jgi:hypothetical protein
MPLRLWAEAKCNPTADEGRAAFWFTKAIDRIDHRVRRREAAMSDINPILVYLAEQRRQDLLREAEKQRLVRSLVVRLENIKFLQPAAAEKRIKK